MATSSEDGDRKEAAFSDLTFDLVVDILYRLSVKVLMKLRCVCKSLNSLISDPKFAKEHLRLSRTLLNRHHLLSCRFSQTWFNWLLMSRGKFLVWDSSLPSVFNSASNTILEETQLTHPLQTGGSIIDSCDGIICFHCCTEGDFNCFLAWNPSTGKFQISPPFLERKLGPVFGFGYDPLTDSYKVVAICCYGSTCVGETQVMVLVHTLGTDSWRSIQSFPSTLPGFPCWNGKFVSGAISWLLRTAPNSWVIVALDLGNETSQELLLPNYGDARVLTLGVLRDCLCILARTNDYVIHVWLMKDYGNQESWTQLFSLPLYNGLIPSCPLNRICFAFVRALYILEDDQLLMDFWNVVLVYNPRDGTVKIPEIQYNSSGGSCIHVYIESLISP